LPEKIAAHPLAKAKVQFYFLKKEPDSLKKTQMIHLHHEPVLKTVLFCHEKYAADD
jgi:hypothetical protein